MTPSPPLTVKLAAALALCAAGAAATDAAAPAQAVPAAQRVATLASAHNTFSRPDPDAHRLVAVPKRRPITGARTVLPVLAARTKSDGRWLRVRLPGRPNSHTGWISARHTTTSYTPWFLRVDVSRRLVTVYRGGRVAKRFRAVVGKPSTPTPKGPFFVEETVRLHGGLVGSPFALALSARSNVLQQFDGGPGQIALHGLGGVGGTPGTAVSHGCIRLKTQPITWLARRIGPGVPVRITR
jgi:lipoprotein-anchoring transpeptidase ErfK/SrfK